MVNRDRKNKQTKTTQRVLPKYIREKSTEKFKLMEGIK